MMQNQLMQLIFWLGVIVSLPTLYRFVYAGSALIWRKLFPTRNIEIKIFDADKSLIKSITLHLDKRDRKRVIDLISDASSKGSK